MRYNFNVKKVGIMKISVGVSNRHCHLTKEVYEKLFGKSELTFKRALNQPGQFASEETIIIKGPKGSIEKVRVLGPFRSYNQVEVSKTDAYKLGINPPVRKSGDLEGASLLELIGPKDKITLPCGIIANRHIHISDDLAKEWGVVDDEPVGVIIDGEKKGLVEAFFKTSSDGYLEIHLDTDDANGFLLKQNDTVEIRFKKKD